MANAMAIVETPTKSAIRLPAITRLNTSRPRLSVPMRWVSDGAWNLSGTMILNGSKGVIHGLKSPQKTTISTRTSPISPIGSPLRRRQRSERRAGVSAGGESESCTDTGIEPGHEKIGDRHGQSEEGDGGQNASLNDREIPHVGRIDDQLADARPCEDGFHEDGT